MALTDRRNISSEGIVIAAVEVFRPAVPPSNDSSASTSDHVSEDADADKADESFGESRSKLAASLIGTACDLCTGSFVCACHTSLPSFTY